VIETRDLSLPIISLDKLTYAAPQSKYTKNFGLAATKSFGILAAAKTNDEYRTGFDKLSQEHPRAAEYITKIDPQLWAIP
jgi:hypothetical protein